ncbi:TIR-like protein FxsC [Hamadaea tsunoensis]|uniref:TIR-like protein FxsC n=1 Tax=Hamadaea tsunoensis TaxID=53368 RepID=UPI0006843C97|nr:TIR-like protein FxsC [Hamadaea tsunoensis]
MAGDQPVQRRDFFISYARVDEPWARWIAVTLEQAGYKTLVQAFDFRPGNDFVHAMRVGAEFTDRTIAVFSESYFTSAYGAAEWQAVFAKDPTGAKGLLIPVVVDEECEPPGLLKARIRVTLVGLSEEEAKVALLEAVDRNPLRPTSAPFPGVPATTPRVVFPGDQPAVSPSDQRVAPSGGRPVVLSGRSDTNASEFPPPPTAPVQLRVRGLVLESATGVPLAGATVVLRDSAGKAFQQLTGDDGGFSFPEVTPGTAHLGAQLKGYRQRTGPVAVEAATMAPDVELRMSRAVPSLGVAPRRPVPADRRPEGPVFHLSYAHTGQGNKDVLRFFDHVVADLDQLITAVPGQSLGFTDRMLSPGLDWQRELLEVLNTCQVFVPLLSERYLHRSPWCVKEWDVFSRRAVRNGDGSATVRSGILPVLWAPVGSGIPHRVQAVQGFAPERAALRNRYAAEGVLGLARMSEKDYREVVWLIALEISRIAAEVVVEPGTTSTTDGLMSQF